jgi:hypothetical protein
MYRGDDIYLLNFWPLDNLNTMGAGARYRPPQDTSVALHGGLNQPNTPFYLQDVQRPAALNSIGATNVTVLDRQRFIGSLKATHQIPLGEAGLKAIAYAEVHSLPFRPARDRSSRLRDPPRRHAASSSARSSAPGRASATATPTSFFRYAKGIAAYGELATPTQLGLDRTARPNAHEIVLALGANWETGPLGIMAGGYVRSFRNASPDLDLNDVDEGIVMVRPHLFFGEYRRPLRRRPRIQAHPARRDHPRPAPRQSRQQASGPARRQPRSLRRRSPSSRPPAGAISAALTSGLHLHGHPAQRGGALALPAGRRVLAPQAPSISSGSARSGGSTRRATVTEGACP